MWYFFCSFQNLAISRHFLKALGADKTLGVKELASTLEHTVFPPQSLPTGRTELVVELHFFVVFSRPNL